MKTQRLLRKQGGIDNKVIFVLDLGIVRGDSPTFRLPTQLNRSCSYRIFSRHTTIAAVAEWTISYVVSSGITDTIGTKPGDACPYIQVLEVSGS